MSNIIKIFTDGSFKKSKNNILCGYGVYFPNGELENVSRPFIHTPLTNQRAELYAIYKAIKLLKTIKFTNAIIYTDSIYSIKCLTEWYKLWQQNNWKNSKNKPVMNQDIIKPILKILDKNIKFIHVNSHTGKKDFESISNDIADKLANDGAEKLK
jgi:ribonuclease HI